MNLVSVMLPCIWKSLATTLKTYMRLSAGSWHRRLLSLIQMMCNVVQLYQCSKTEMSFEESFCHCSKLWTFVVDTTVLRNLKSRYIKGRADMGSVWSFPVHFRWNICFFMLNDTTSIDSITMDWSATKFFFL